MDYKDIINVGGKFGGWTRLKIVHPGMTLFSSGLLQSEDDDEPFKKIGH